MGAPTRKVVQSRATGASLLPPVVWEGFYVQVLRKVDSNDIISTVKWSAWPKVAWFAIPAHRTLIPTNHISHNLAIKGLYQSVLERGPRADIANHATFGHAAHFTVEIISLESTLIKNGTQELSQTTGGSKLAPVALDCTTFRVATVKGSRPFHLGSLRLSRPGGLTMS